jgi:hypothetical protein
MRIELFAKIINVTVFAIAEALKRRTAIYDLMALQTGQTFRKYKVMVSAVIGLFIVACGAGCVVLTVRAGKPVMVQMAGSFGKIGG